MYTEFNAETNEVKAKLSNAKKKRVALLESMMFKKFNVIQGYDYAKQLRDLTEEIYTLKLNLYQMNKVQAKLGQITPFVLSANAENIKKESVAQVRTELISDYYIFTGENPKESAPSAANIKSAENSPQSEKTAEKIPGKEEQTG
jgi:hypothetical protein